MGILSRLGLKAIGSNGKRLGLKAFGSGMKRLGKKAVLKASTQIVKHKLKDKAIKFGTDQAVKHGSALAEKQVNKMFSKRQQIQKRNDIIKDSGNDPFSRESIRHMPSTAPPPISYAT